MNNKLVGALIGIALSLLLATGADKIHSYKMRLSQCQEDQKELKYLRETAILSDCIYRDRMPVSPKVIKEMLEQIDKFLPKYFPNGPYTREDFIALAWLESAFNQYEIGTHQEKGIFQIMPDEFQMCKVKKNKYDIAVNTELCMYVLQHKYIKYPDYKKAIIAYNGVVKSKKGRWNEKYWRAFIKRKSVVETLLG